MQNLISSIAPRLQPAPWCTATGLILLSLAAACADSDSGGDGGSSNAGTTSAASGGAGGNSGAGAGGNSGSSGSAGSSGSDGVADGGSFDAGNFDAGSLAMDAVDLRSAGYFVILAKSGISTVPTSAITGNLGASPVTATAITGFSLTKDASNTFARSSQVTGSVYASDYTTPTPAYLTTAISDMELALTDAASRAPDVTELGAGNIGGMTLTAGVYKWGTGLLIPSDITLMGSATDVWIFQIAQDLTVSNATNVFLAGDALPKNVFWQVDGLVEIGTTAHFEGVILCQTAITLSTGASINGRLLAQTAVDLDANIVVQPAN